MTAPDAASWFDAARAAFAGTRLGGASVDLRVAGRAVRLETPDPAFRAVAMRAMGHLAINAPADEQDLRLMLWNAAERGAQLAAPSIAEGSEQRNGAILPYCDERRWLFANDHLKTIVAADRAAGWTLVQARDASTLPWYERAAPLRDPLTQWMAGFGAHVVHSAAVATEHGGVLLTGVGGSGKSTTALLCLLDGMDYLGDDWCIMEGGKPPTIHSLYNSAKLHYDNLHRVPELQRVVAEQDGARDEKAVAFLHADRVFGPRLRVSAPAKAALLPRVTGRPETTIEPAGPRDFWHALVPTTMTCIPGCGTRSFEVLTALTRQLPVWRLSLGTRLEDIPRAIREFLARS